MKTDLPSCSEGLRPCPKAGFTQKHVMDRKINLLKNPIVVPHAETTMRIRSWIADNGWRHCGFHWLSELATNDPLKHILGYGHMIWITKMQNDGIKLILRVLTVRGKNCFDVNPAQTGTSWFHRMVKRSLL